MTTTNIGAASLSDEQRGAVRWALAHVERHGYEAGSVYDGYAKAFKALLAAHSPQADAAPTFDAWATKEGLISESHGVRFVNSMCDVARKVWDAAIAAGWAQEPIYQVMVGEKWVDSTAAEYAAVSNEKRIVYAAPLPREAATVWQPIETAPKTGRTLLLGYLNSAGKWRTVRGQWMSEAYISEQWEEPDDAEPGWYETSVEADDPPNCWPIEPTHWMPLPAAPAESNGAPK
jgi:hypothetical protein